MVDRPEPEYVPERLSMSVHDDLGDWTLDIRRHAQTVDMLFRGNTDLSAAMTAARPDIESALAAAGHSLGSFDHRGQSPYPPERPEPVVRARVSTRTERRPVHQGRIDRIA
jgi:hypothetical protein